MSGNPVAEKKLDELLSIAQPDFYQVSLEGLEEHNDYIRGKGSLKAVVDFLDLLRKLIDSMVMLTLTEANTDQVLPLTECLRNRVDQFTFNRLATVGERANLDTPHPSSYRDFTAKYLAACKNNPAMGLKDSFFNIQLEQQEEQEFGGCTGYGCGAAFNFVSLLADGKVYACRKFPSMIGDIHAQILQEVTHHLRQRRTAMATGSAAPAVSNQTAGDASR